MKQLEFFKNAGAGGVAAVLPSLLPLGCRSDKNAGSTPNIIYILTDGHAAPGNTTE